MTRLQTTRRRNKSQRQLSAKASDPTLRDGKRRRSWFRGAVLRLAAMALATVFALLLAEMLVRVSAPQNLSGTWRTTDRNGLFLHQKNHTARHQYAGRVVYYRFDSAGLRDLGQGRQGIRILCLGDSLAMGHLLDNDDTFISHLQRMADTEFGKNHFLLLNGGHGGWGTSDYVRFFEEYGNDFSPAGVIVFLSADDIGRSLREPKYVLVDAETQRLRKVTRVRKDSLIKRVLNSMPGYNWLLEHSHLFELVRNVAAFGFSRAWRLRAGVGPAQTEQAVPELKSPVGDDPARARALGSALFRRLKVLADARSAGLLVLSTGFHRPAAAGDREPTRAFVAKAEEIFREERIAFYDCSGEFRERIQGDYSVVTIPGDGHPNEYGAQLIAELNWPYVRSFLANIDQLHRVDSSSG